MRIHLLQTGTVEVHERQRRGSGRGVIRLINAIIDRKWTEPLPIYSWMIEHPEGAILVDTGESARTHERGYFPWWHPYFRFAVRCHVKPNDEIGPQLHSIGISPSDVRWVVLTHLHTDHAGGINHFPSSEFVVSRTEYQAASGVAGQLRGFLSNRWPSWFKPTLIDFTGEPLGPFLGSLALTKALDVRLVPTEGHTSGHLSVILQEGERDIFFAGDAAYSQDLMLEGHPDGVCSDLKAARRTLKRIARFASERPTVFLPAHDPESGARFRDRLVVPAGA